MISFEPTENQTLIRNTVRDFAEKNIRPYLMEWDESQTLPLELFKKYRKGGYNDTLTIAYKEQLITIDITKCVRVCVVLCVVYSRACV